MPAPDLTLGGLVSNFLCNRSEYYSVMIKRTPEPILGDRLGQIFQVSTAEDERLLKLDFAAIEQLDEYLDGLSTLDILKKPSHGTALGRTTISVDESLVRAEDIERTGLLLFSHIQRVHDSHANAFANAVEQGKRAYALLLQLHDELRYHRVSLTP